MHRISLCILSLPGREISNAYEGVPLTDPPIAQA